MQSKPELFASEYGAWFQDPLVVEAYPARPPYPTALIEHLAGLAVDEPKAVLDVGCGTGEIARRLAPLVDHVDAVDASEGMLNSGRAARGGDAPNLRWIHSRIEEAVVEPPYALITAGESLHWFDWELVMPRFASMLSPHGTLAMASRNWEGSAAVRERVQPVLRRFGLVTVWQNVNLLDELQKRGLFEVTGKLTFAAEPWQPTLEEYVLARHSQRSFSRTHMGAAAVGAFGAALAEALSEVPRADGRLLLEVSAQVCWGRPRG